MEQEQIFHLLKQVQSGERTPEDALRYLKLEPEMQVGNYTPFLCMNPLIKNGTLLFLMFGMVITG